MDFSRWAKKRVSVANIDLDDLNPRIPGRDLSQRDLIADLVRNSKVGELARAIAEKGYYPTEDVVLVKKKPGRYVVVEGNRRIAALKLLQQPSLGPEPDVSKFQRIANRLSEAGRRALETVNASIAPTRIDAEPLMADRHTGPAVERWSTLMQARFYDRLLAAGRSSTQIISQFGITAGDLARFIKQVEMYDIARQLPLEAPVRAKLLDERDFPVTSLERIYNNPRARRILGIEFDDLGRVRGKIDSKEFQKGYSRVIRDLVEDRSDSRRLDSAEDIVEYMSSLGSDQPDTSKIGTFDARSIAQGSSPKPISTPPRSARHQIRQHRGLIPARFAFTFKNAKLRKIFDELRSIPVERYPNATAILFRSFLHIAFLQLAKKHHLLSQVRSRAHGEPTLGELMEFFGGDTQTIISDRSKRAVLRKAKSQHDLVTSLDSLNAFAHNDSLLVTSSSARQNWEYFEAVLADVLPDLAPKK